MFRLYSLTWRSLKTRVTLLSLVIFLVCIWSLVYYAGSVLHKDLQLLLGEQQYSAVSIVAANVNQEMDFRFRSLESIANSILPQTFSNPLALQSLLEDRPILQKLFNGGFYAVRADGTTIADVPRSTGRIGMDVSEKVWMVQALQGHTSIGKPVVGKKLGVPVFTMATPIKGPGGTVIGVLAGVIDLSTPNFLDQLTGNRYGKSGDFLLVAPQYRLIVTSSDKSRVMENLPDKGLNPELDRFVDGYEGTGILTNPKGVEVLASAKRVPAAGWYVAALLPVSVAFSPIQNLQQHVMSAAILLTLLSGAVIWWMLRRQLFPMLEAVEALSTLADENLPVSPLPVTRQDEVGLLIGSFNSLLEVIAHRESALLENKNTISQLLDATDQGIYGIDNDGRCTFINRAGLGMIGYELEECLGKDMHDLIHHSFANGQPYPVDDCPIYKAKITGSGCRLDNEVLWRMDGTSFPAEYSSHPVMDNGLIRGAVITFTDISARKQSEEESLVLQAQLQQAQKMESIGRLAGGVAHDFNNMLTVVLGYSQLGMYETGPEGVLHKYFEEIVKTSNRSADLTRQLLAFASKQTITTRPLDLNEVVTGMLKMLQRLIGEHISLTWQPAPDLWRIKADPSQIDQIMANLCVNARDAIGTKGQLTIKTDNVAIDTFYKAVHPDAVPGDYVHLSVSDTGCGMDRETLSHIFEPFYTTKELGKGTGLGLATVFGIVKQNNGFIYAYSEPGEGTVFSLYLPRLQEMSVPAVIDAAPVFIPRGTETILLVEDEPAIMQIAAVMLEKQGYTVLKTNNPAEALQLASDHHGEVHLLMTDVIMPEQNGRELADRIVSRFPRIKCLFMSGYTADVISDHGVLEEGVNFIQKPFALPDLASKVREVLDA